MLVNSHLHFDHCGGNKHIPDAKLVLHEQELAEARDCQPFERSATPIARGTGTASRSRRSRATSSSRQGLWLFETPGHTIGHYSLLAKPSGGERALLFAVDVVYTRRGVREGRPARLPLRPGRGRPLDPAAARPRRGARRRDPLLPRHGRVERLSARARGLRALGRGTADEAAGSRRDRHRVGAGDRPRGRGEAGGRGREGRARRPQRAGSGAGGRGAARRARARDRRLAGGPGAAHGRRDARPLRQGRRARQRRGDRPVHRRGTRSRSTSGGGS